MWANKLHVWLVSECGAVFNTTEGTIYSPGYPDYYPNNANCTYDIVGDPHKTTIIKFPAEHFALGHPRTPSRPGDTIDIGMATDTIDLRYDINVRLKADKKPA